MSLVGRLASHLTDRIYDLPILVLMPHSRCNCRCVMCDIWKANHDKRELSVEDLRRHVADFVKIGVKYVTLSGGEALLHSNLWAFCGVLREENISIALLSTGLTLEKHAREVAEYFDGVIVSLDGSENVHNSIRNIPGAFEKMAAGVTELRKVKPTFRVTGRSVLQHSNYKDFINTIEAARRIGLNQISFLAADVSTTAFNRDQPWEKERIVQVALSPEETDELEKILNDAFEKHPSHFESGFVAESPEKLLQIVAYYRAINGIGDFKSPPCNAPWVSAVVESNGDILPCYFHKPYGNIRDGFYSVLNAAEAINFRRSLKVDRDPVCKKCVCSLKRSVWA